MNTSLDINKFYPDVGWDFFVYCRKENLNEYTIKSNRTGVPVKIVNKVFMEIIELCNGKNSVKDIMKVLSNRYKNVPQKELLSDLKQVLKTLTDMNALSNLKNPILDIYSVKAVNNMKIELSNYTIDLC